MALDSDLSVGRCATLACILEVTARKPGNVHPQACFTDVDYVDFMQSALVLGPLLEDARTSGVGATIRLAVERCREIVPSNTNLGMVLLLTPLAAVPPGQPLREGVVDVLSRLTMSDVSLVYEAIRIAQPGGLGRVDEQDVAGEPTLGLVDVMRLAADRDLIARQYANGFREVFDDGVPSLQSAERIGLNWEQVIIRCHLELMARHADTLIARKRGWSEARESADRAAAVLAAGWPGTEHSIHLFSELDQWLRAVGHERNPGTTADLVAASLFVAFRQRALGFACHR
jgi:triphosphoribosyl-dephospho-CoA synthase